MERVRTVGIVVAGVLFVTLGLSTLLAQDQPPKSPGQPAMQGKEVTLTGKVVDLHCFMTGVTRDKYAAKCTQKCLREGVPAALETDGGLILLGKGMTGIGREASRHALGMVEVKGKLYEKHGLKYLDAASMKEVKETESEEWIEEPEPEEEPAEPNEP
jgi:hypothetical protein